MVAPAVLVIAALLAYPVGYAVYLSVMDWNDTISPIHTFAGLGNYAGVLSDGDFWAALQRTLYFSVITVAVGVLFALLLALALTVDFRGRTIARVVLLVPWALPPVVNGIMWKLIFDGNVGIVNAVLRNLGFIRENIQFLANPALTLNILIFAEIWKLVPFLTLLLIAALQNVPANLQKAASIDGAGPLQRLVHITLPNIRSAILFALIVQSMWSLKVFDTIYVLTGGSGGPANGTTTINFFGYLTTFSQLDRGYGAAIALLIMVLVIVVTLFWLGLFALPELIRTRIGRSRGYES